MEIVKLEQTLIHQSLASKDGLDFEMYCSNMTMPLAYAKPCLAELRQNTEDKNILKTIYTILMRKLKSFGKRGEMNDEEIRAVAIDFFKMRRDMSLEDLVLILDKGRQGEFGKVFGNVDAVLINEWTTKYADMKSQLRERMHRTKKHELIIHGDLTQSLKSKLKSDDDI